MRRYQATEDDPKPGLRGVLRQLLVGTDIWWGGRVYESIGRWESAGHLWRGISPRGRRREGTS
jgi:hypothetical protein